MSSVSIMEELPQTEMLAAYSSYKRYIFFGRIIWLLGSKGQHLLDVFSVRREAKGTTVAPYPILRRYVDAHELVPMSEFTIVDMVIAAGVFNLLAGLTGR